MGRVTPSFRVKLAEAERSIERDLVKLLINDRRRKAYRRLRHAWREESAALSGFPHPYIYGSLLILSAIDLQAQLEELEKRVAELEKRVRELEK